MQQTIVFTDMDGTLLDHHSYSHKAAESVLLDLKKNKIPVIPNTSKTFDEMTVLMQEIGLDGPFIVENGAAIHIPDGFFKHKPSSAQWSNNYWLRQFTAKKSHWINVLKHSEKLFAGQFTHFANMTIAQISDATGLNPQQAQRAATRQFGEPVLWLGSDSEKQRFIEHMQASGANPLVGGRFIHISGACNKGMAMQWILSEFKRQYPELSYRSIALGDGQNDSAMLNNADIAVKVLSPVNPLPELSKTDQVYTTQLPGPAGWAASLKHILQL